MSMSAEGVRRILQKQQSLRIENKVQRGLFQTFEPKRNRLQSNYTSNDQQTQQTSPSRYRRAQSSTQKRPFLEGSSFITKTSDYKMPKYLPPYQLTKNDYGAQNFDQNRLAIVRQQKLKQEAYFFYSRGYHYQQIGKLKEAISEFQIFLNHCYQSGDLIGLMTSYNYLGCAYLLLFYRHKKEVLLRKAVDMFQKHLKFQRSDLVYYNLCLACELLPFPENSKANEYRK
ncbi:hypothetical protein pb186bvf_010905 [Paramecium bursaria]